MGGAAAAAPCAHVGGEGAARRGERGVERPPQPGGCKDTSVPTAAAEAGRRQAWRERRAQAVPANEEERGLVRTDHPPVRSCVRDFRAADKP